MKPSSAGLKLAVVNPRKKSKSTRRKKASMTSLFRKVAGKESTSSKILYLVKSNVAEKENAGVKMLILVTEWMQDVVTGRL